MAASPRQVGAGDSRLRLARAAARAALTTLTNDVNHGVARDTRADRPRRDLRRLIRMLLRLMTLRAAHARGLSGAEHAFDVVGHIDADASGTNPSRAAIASVEAMVAGEAFAWLETDLAPDLLGRVYEDLLACDVEASVSSRRKTGGSYYTPAALVEHLLDLALEPVIASHADVESIRLLDPSCGGGHFLLGAARRLTSHLMRAKPNLTRSEAMTRVVTRCLYGVDLDAEAVDVCRVALWLESSSPQASPTSLKIRRGHALLGAVPGSKLPWGRIPDEAFETREGDDPRAAASLREQNHAERGDLEPTRLTKLLADACCAAFVAPRTPGALIPTTAVIQTLARGERIDAAMIASLEACASRHGFLHWAIEFPEVWPANDAARHGFDVIVGNPPFLNQLETATVTSRREESLMRALSGGVLRGYTDLSATFLLRASQLAANDGRVALVQPQSLLAAKDAGPVREAVLRTSRLEAIWVSNQRVFEGACVFTCAPVLHVGGSDAGRIRRTAGADFHDVAPASISLERLREAETWAPLAAAAAGVPEVRLAKSGTIGELATATADFRDQYYGLAGFLVEEAALTAAATREDFPPLITSGLIDPACVLWGLVSTRVLKRAWVAPRVDRRRMEREGQLGAWMRQRLVPKVLLATQTRVMEAAADERGELLPCTPVITLTPRDASDLWLLAAAVSSPVVSAVALERYSGAAMTADAVKVSAKQVMGLPLPVRGSAWAQGAERFREAMQASDERARRTALEAFGLAMCGAYGLEPAAAARVFQWWRERLEPRRRRAEG